MFKPIRVSLSTGQIHSFSPDEGVRVIYLVAGNHPDFVRGVSHKLDNPGPAWLVAATEPCVFGALIEVPE